MQRNLIKDPPTPIPFKIFLDTQKDAWYSCSNLHNDCEEKSKRMELPKRAPAGEKECGKIC